MQVTKKEGYESIKNLSELVSKAVASEQKQTTDAPVSLPTQEIVDKDQIKSAADFANGKKFDGQLEAALLKNRLNDTAARLDKFQEGDLKGFEKEAKKAKVEDLGVIKDNLGMDIVKKEGPGIEDMYKKSEKYEMPDRDPLKGLPKTVKQEKDAKKAPDMPLKDDPSLASDDNLKGLLPNLFGDDKKNPTAGQQLDKIKENLGANKPDGGTPPLKEFEPKKKYEDPDQAGTLDVEKPKDPPPNSKDLLGHKVNPLHHAPIIDTENVDIKKVVAEHKGPKKTQIYTDPDQMQKKAKFDPANPPRIEENELKNTGNPNDFTATQFELPKGGGDKPHTDGEGGDQPKFEKVTTAGGANDGSTKEIGFGGLVPTPTDGEEEENPQNNGESTNVPH